MDVAWLPRKTAVLAAREELGEEEDIASPKQPDGILCLYLRPKLASETDDHYGTEIYGQFYRIDDHSDSGLKASAGRAARKIIAPLRRA